MLLLALITPERGCSLRVFPGDGTGGCTRQNFTATLIFFPVIHCVTVLIDTYEETMCVRVGDDSWGGGCEGRYSVNCPSQGAIESRN